MLSCLAGPGRLWLCGSLRRRYVDKAALYTGCERSGGFSHRAGGLEGRATGLRQVACGIASDCYPAGSGKLSERDRAIKKGKPDMSASLFLIGKRYGD